MVDELKPCPFCGAKPEIYKMGKWYAECDPSESVDKYGASHRVEIYASGNLVLRDDVVAAWNRRAPEQKEKR